jgi:hypothetical protein
MFAKSKVSQSMIDAVNKVLGEQPVQPAQPVQPVGVKEELLNEGWDDMVKDAKEKMKSGPKPSGGAGKKEGSRYGGSKQKDEKPVKEELKGSQHKIDANNNNKIDGQDFAILRGKKKRMREHLNDMPFAKKLLEKELDEGLMKKAFKALTGGSDEDQRKDLQRKMGVPQTGEKPESEIKYAAKTLVKHAKDPLGLKKEEVEQIDEYGEPSKYNSIKRGVGVYSHPAPSGKKDVGVYSHPAPSGKKDVGVYSHPAPSGKKDVGSPPHPAPSPKAHDKMKKEEVEQIDELSKSTLSSYLDKKKSEYMKGKTQSGSKENAKDIQNMGKAHDKMKKEELEQAEAESLIENFEMISEVSLGAKIKAYASHSSDAFEHGDMGNDEESEHHNARAEKIHAHILKHHGTEAANHAEKAATSAIFGTGKHKGSDSLSGGLRGQHSKSVTKSGKIPKNTQSAMKNSVKGSYGKRIVGPKGHLPEEFVEEADITTDGLDGRKDGGAENTFNLFKKKLKGDVAPNPKESDKPEETAARKSKIPIPKPTDSQSPQEVDNLDKKYGNPNTFKEEKEEPPFDKPYTKTKNFTVTDKSGAKHTPMSRARDLAQYALKKVKDKTKIKN